MDTIQHIGIFDSGIGGLSVANIFLSQRPDIKITYLGDNAFFPFGELPHETILDRTTKAINFLKTAGCQKIVIACNTASIIAEQSNLSDKALLWLITPPVKKAIVDKNPKSLSIYATRFTVDSEYYQSALDGLVPKDSIQTFARPDLVNSVEHSGVYPQSHEIERYNGECTGDLVLLACTHFHYIKPMFDHHFSGSKQIVDSAEIASKSFLDMLPSQHKTKKQLATFYFTSSDQLPDIALNMIRRWDARPVVINSYDKVHP